MVEDHINFTERTLTVFQKDIPCFRDSYFYCGPSCITSLCTTILAIQRCIKIKFTGTGEMVQWVTNALVTKHDDLSYIPSNLHGQNCIAKLSSDLHMHQHGTHIHTQIHATKCLQKKTNLLNSGGTRL